jgi:hypothetical protein
MSMELFVAWKDVPRERMTMALLANSERLARRI